MQRPPQRTRQAKTESASGLPYSPIATMLSPTTATAHTQRSTIIIGRLYKLLMPPCIANTSHASHLFRLFREATHKSFCTRMRKPKTGIHSERLLATAEPCQPIQHAQPFPFRTRESSRTVVHRQRCFANAVTELSNTKIAVLQNSRAISFPGDVLWVIHLHDCVPSFSGSPGSRRGLASSRLGS